MSPTFWRRLPNFAAGALLGTAFAVIYVQQRMIASSVKPLDDFQKNIGEFTSQQKLQFHFTLQKDWNGNPHFPIAITLQRGLENGQIPQDLQSASIDGREGKLEVEYPLPVGKYRLRVDVVACQPVEKRPLCYGQMQYFAFTVNATEKKSAERFVLEPQSLPIPQ